MTTKELTRIYHQVKHAKIGYCCYQEDNKSVLQLIELEWNKGIYGWNWTAYLDRESDTLYVSCYRNVPKEIVNK